jgi:molybdopterin-binding protein
VDIGDGKTLASIISRSAADDLGLKAGVPVVAFFNTSQVILAVD